MGEIYVHIPFCKAKCRYCDFNSIPCANEATIFGYLAALNKEIRFAAEQYPAFEARTIYIGGGTPSLLDGRRIAGIMQNLRERFSVSADAEVTVEANPESLTEEKLEAYREAGINRLSVGVQSLSDLNLRGIGRLHSVDIALEKLALAKKYFDNLSADLMIGLPYDNADLVKEEIRTLAPGLRHMSVYQLTLEEGTPLYKRVQDGLTLLPGDDETADLMDAAIDTLEECGLLRYEVSNFAREGFYSRHNYGYWSGEEYIGFGAGAHSFIKTFDGQKPLAFAIRFASPKDINAYIGGVNCVSAFNDIPRTDVSVLSEKDLKNEEIMLGLRTTRGVKEELLGGRIPAELDRFFKREDGYISLTREGIAVMNGILIRILEF